jgi:(4S)-4-hydroxy-5-phosphonooxypentane-2,3-dione isomerase
MIVLVARYYARSGHEDAVAEAMERMAAEVKRREPGCALYQVCRSREDARSFLLYEVYADEAALAAHREAPHFKEIVEGQVAPLLEKREREFFTLMAG